MRFWSGLFVSLVACAVSTEASAKYYYCARIVEGFRSVRCENCWTWIGGEGGRVACTVRYGGAQVNVHYGRCEETRNAAMCRY